MAAQAAASAAERAGHGVGLGTRLWLGAEALHYATCATFATIESAKLQVVNIDAETRKVMLDRQNRLLIGLVDEHAVHARQESTLLTNVDSWMGNAASKLEQDEDYDNAFTTPQVRANAMVGQLLNEQTARGEQLADVHTKMADMMAKLQVT